uniref:SUN domain-containing protein 2-like n=1 Tax=Phascolarctos cinereus TaxID=38626 RepID=A0A6P5KKU0_PHACI|nr:SUN domain-containing protein 2-like [Phascolarctos cinereus]
MPSGRRKKLLLFVLGMLLLVASLAHGACYFYPSGLHNIHPAMLSWWAAKGSSRREDMWESGEFTPYLQPNVYPGNGWAFQGPQSFVGVCLSACIDLTAITVEHVPRALSSISNITRAPKDFVILGLNEDSQVEGVALRQFTYDNAGEAIQTFHFQGNSTALYQVVELRVLSNWVTWSIPAFTASRSMASLPISTSLLGPFTPSSFSHQQAALPLLPASPRLIPFWALWLLGERQKVGALLHGAILPHQALSDMDKTTS